MKAMILVLFTALISKASENRLSLIQKKMLVPNSSYAEFFRSDALPEYKDLKQYYFLEDLVVPAEEFSSEKITGTRARLKQLFEHYVYGYAPEIPEVTLTLVSERKNVDVGNGVAADIKDLDLTLLLDVPGKKNPVVRLSLFSPPNISRPPVFLSLNKCGNHRVAAKGIVPIRQLAFTAPECHEAWFEKIGTDVFWSVDYVISQGYALATFHESDISPDNVFLARTGVQSFYRDIKYNNEHGWGSIAAWGWGLRAAAKALREQISLVDNKRIIAIGHSRRGKAALLATAFDPEISAVMAHQTGTWGLALARNHFLNTRAEYAVRGFSWWPKLGSQMETIAVNNFLFDHWFNHYSEKFHWDETRLPLDQHLLLALLAPRVVLSTEGDLDLWSNADSSLVSLQQGSRYYSQGLVPNEKIAQIRLREEHTLTREFWREIVGYTKNNLAPSK